MIGATAFDPRGRMLYRLALTDTLLATTTLFIPLSDSATSFSHFILELEAFDPVLRLLPPALRG